MFDIKRIYNLNLKDNIIIEGINYNIRAKIKFSNIDEKRDIVRYYIVKADNTDNSYVLELESGNDTAYLISQFTVSNLFSEENLAKEYKLDKKRFMVLDTVGIQHYNIASCVNNRMYQKGNNIIIIEENLGRTTYFSGERIDFTKIFASKEREKKSKLKIRMVGKRTAAKKKINYTKFLIILGILVAITAFLGLIMLKK